MRCAALQFDVRTRDPLRNLADASALIQEAARRQVELVVLPELWACSFSPDIGPDLLHSSAECVRELTRLSHELGIAIAGSTHGASEGDGALPTNRFHLLRNGEALPAYDKVHLFSPTAEHFAFRGGESAPLLAHLGEVPVAGVICYDLRFPELCRVPIRRGAEVLIVCAQWPSTRASHWRALVIGRAVEGQCYVIAANRCGSALVGRRRLQLEFPGNSLIVAPDGEVLAEGEGEAGLVEAELDLSLVRELRRQIPVLEDERRDLHASWHSAL